MKRKRIEKVVNMHEDTIVKINKGTTKDYFFEIGDQMTTDVAEAVAIMMRKKELINSELWNLTIEVDEEMISPEKSLYWLTGGDKEWKTLDNYNTSWCDCYLDFQEEFGIIITSIVKKSKTLKDIRDRFMRHLNLPILYDFAINRGLVG